MTFFVYVLRTSANTLYTGQTNNLVRRLREHQNKSGRGSKYVRSFESSEVVYVEELPTRSEAMKREAEIRRWTKKKKERLIAENR